MARNLLWASRAMVACTMNRKSVIDGGIERGAGERLYMACPGYGRVQQGGGRSVPKCSVLRI